MKNIFKTLALAAVVTFTACNDAIEIDQPGRLGASQAFRSVADLQSGLLGTYNNFTLSGQVYFNSVFTDEISIGFDSGGQGLVLYGFQLNPSSGAASSRWTRNYSALNSASRIIEAGLALEPDLDPADQADFDNIMGQAYALRAYAHFTLLAYLSPDYTDANAPGTIIVDFVPTVDQLLPKNTTGEVWAAIESDLSTADGLLGTGNGNRYVTPDFVKALRARIAAYRQDYATALTLSNQLVADYPLADRTQYFEMFDDAEDDTEVIFKLSRTVGDSYDTQGPTGSAAGAGWIGANFAFVNSTLDGSPYFEMSRSLFNQMDPNDIRYDVIVDPTSIISPDYQNEADFRTADILVMSKYPGKDGQPLMADHKIFRASEMLLIRAEAKAAQGDLAGAAADVKMLRDARFSTAQPLPSYASAQEAFGDILDERRIELAYEGHRYLDLKRLGQRAGRGIDRDPLDCAIVNACDLPLTDHRWAFPVPLVELNANNVIEQTPGY